jgi:segregation and condensation protein B
MLSMEGRALLCAALLAADRPVASTELQRLLGVSPEGLTRVVDDLRATLVGADLGLVVDEVAGGYRLVVASRLVGSLAGLLAPSPLPSLSNAALETLALVAYHQPVTRGELEAARGASCSSTLDTLQERELVKAIGHKEIVGRPLLYATTARFLLEFGLRSLNDLPALEGQPDSFLRG